jgi:HlyD family secretion protein
MTATAQAAMRYVLRMKAPAARLSPRPLVLALVAAVALGGSCQRPPEPLPAPGDIPRTAVTALGRVTPGRTVISIAAQPGSRILRLEAAEGKRVVAGEILATLDTYPLRLAERDAARVVLGETRERLETEVAYGTAMIGQSREAVRVLQLANDHERSELKRLAALIASQTAPQKALDDQQFLLETREAELNKANADLRSAEAQLVRARSLVGVKTAEANVKVAEAQLELSLVRAPIDGEVLKVFTYPGERIVDGPVLQMGDTGDMHVIAEVRETDVGAVRVGQRATIASPALPALVSGTVAEIGRLIFKNDVLDPDPRADRDSRVVEVRIKLDTPEAVARLTRLEVSTRIEVGTPAASVGR